MLGVLLGDDGVCQEILDRDREYGPAESRGHALAEIERALCMVKAGEVGQGLDGAAVVLSSLPLQHRTTAVTRWAHQVIKATPETAQRFPAAHELRAPTGGVTTA